MITYTYTVKFYYCEGLGHSETKTLTFDDFDDAVEFAQTCHKTMGYSFISLEAKSERIKSLDGLA